MKRMVMTALMLILSVFYVGCGNIAKKTDPTKMALAYYGQERVYKTMEVTGANEITFKGTNLNFTVSNQLTPLSIYPRDPSTLATLIDGAVRLGTVAGATYVGATLADGAAKDPTVVVQEPLIVRPEVITP